MKKETNTNTPASQPQERYTITLDDTKYFVDTLPEKATTLLNHIQIVDDEITRLSTQKSIADIAKQKLIDDLSKMQGDFEAVPEAPDMEPEPAA